MIRTKRNTWSRAVLLTLTVGFALAAAPLHADDRRGKGVETVSGANQSAAAPLRADNRPWTVRGFAAWIDGGLDLKATYSDSSIIQLEADYGGGLNAAIEYRPSERLGFELSNLAGGVGTAQLNNGGVRTESSNLGFNAVLLGLNVYLTSSDAVQVYVSPIVGQVWFSSWDYSGWGYGGSWWRIGNEFVWGGGVGIDIPVAKSAWSVSLVAKYLDASSESGRRDTFAPIEARFDPFVIGVGFGFRF